MRVAYGYQKDGCQIKVLYPRRLPQIKRQPTKREGEPSYNHLSHNIDLFTSRFFVRRIGEELRVAKPHFTKKRALQFLGLKSCNSKTADQCTAFWGQKIYEDSKRPLGERELDHGRATKVYRAYLALGS